MADDDDAVELPDAGAEPEPDDLDDDDGPGKGIDRETPLGGI